METMIQSGLWNRNSLGTHDFLVVILRLYISSSGETKFDLELSRGQASDWCAYTWTRQTQATTIPGGQNWHRVKKKKTYVRNPLQIDRTDQRCSGWRLRFDVLTSSLWRASIGCGSWRVSRKILRLCCEKNIMTTEGLQSWWYCFLYQHQCMRQFCT